VHIKVVTSSESFVINGKKETQTMKLTDKLVYLRIMISRITKDSMLTVAYIRKTFSELDDYMISVDNNVTTFN